MLDQIQEGAERLHVMASNIHDANLEVGDAIDEASKEVDETRKQQSFVMGKLSKLLKTKDNKQLYTIIVLWGVMMFQIFLLIF